MDEESMRLTGIGIGTLGFLHCSDSGTDRATVSSCQRLIVALILRPMSHLQFSRRTLSCDKVAVCKCACRECDMPSRTLQRCRINKN